MHEQFRLILIISTDRWPACRPVSLPMFASIPCIHDPSTSTQTSSWDWASALAGSKARLSHAESAGCSSYLHRPTQL